MNNKVLERLEIEYELHHWVFEWKNDIPNLIKANVKKLDEEWKIFNQANKVIKLIPLLSTIFQAGNKQKGENRSLKKSTCNY